ncbi:MAG: hypothetical protein C4582_05335 [Desulfobacteraceae bacterium]|jgi:hypothetical protein|nr:MAG: hypothetical protein C4582_05335 [Desulfobacteraceae bacterium]
MRFTKQGGLGTKISLVGSSYDRILLVAPRQGWNLAFEGDHRKEKTVNHEALHTEKNMHRRFIVLTLKASLRYEKHMRLHPQPGGQETKRSSAVTTNGKACQGQQFKDLNRAPS